MSYDVPQRWAGPQHGLPPYRLLLAINGRPASEFAAVYAGAAPGDPVT